MAAKLSNVGRALKKAAKGFIEGMGPRPYKAAGKKIVCPHCGGEAFSEGEGLITTSWHTVSGMAGWDVNQTTLACEKCGLIQWFAKRPDLM